MVSTHIGYSQNRNRLTKEIDESVLVMLLKIIFNPSHNKGIKFHVVTLCCKVWHKVGD